MERLEERRLLAVLYWDPDLLARNNLVATGAGLGGSGTWTEGGAAVWFNPTLGGGTGGYVSWNSSRGDTAVFTGPAGGTVAISGGVGAAAIEFRGGAYTVSGGTFSTPAAGTMFTTVVAARFDTPITGGGRLVKAGAASLTLGAPLHAYTGDTLISAGVLDVRGTIRSHVRRGSGDVQGVMFFDPDLAAAVRESLALDLNAWLTPAVLAQSPPLTSLTVDGNVVGDLTGIVNLAALESLELIPGDHAAAPQGLASLQPLAGLGNLASLSVVHVGLTDAGLATLPALSGLTRLDVRSNSLSTVPAGVAQLPKLATLLVHGNPLLVGSPRTALATLKGKAIDVDVAADRPEAATSIADLAARLYYLPLDMLEYVTNTIVFQPYSGAMKGPLATLQTKAGNDWDTNSLLASLYAAAGISTRYVSGAVEVTEAQLKDFVGARDAAAAATILAKAGLDYGQYVNRFKHTWLEALVTVPATGRQAWVPIDASWKLRDFRPGLPDVLTKVPFGPQEADYLTNPAWQRKSTAEYYEAKVAGWLAQSRPDLTIFDVGYDGPIRQQAFPSLPTALPYAIVSQPAETARPAAIPAAAHYTVNIKLANGSTQLFGAAGISLTLADVALSRLTIDPVYGWWGVLGGASGWGWWPTLRQDGVAIATASSFVRGPAASSLSLKISITAPAGGTSYDRTFTRPGDRFIAIGLDANQFSETLLVEKRAVANAQQLKKANGGAVDRDQAVGGLLDLAIASYFTAANADEASLASLTSAVADRTIVALGIATSGPELSFSATAGLQFPYLPDGMGIDVPANVSGAFAIDASTTAIDLNRNLLMGYANSSLEGLVLEQLTNFESVSTMKAFQLAATAAGGFSNLVEINTGNVARIATLLPGLRSEIVSTIASTVTKGLPGYIGTTFTALVPKNEITVGAGSGDRQWKGVGYTLTIAASGATVGFMIQGSVGGGPILTYGGATSRIPVLPPAIRPTPLAWGIDKEAGDPVNVANGNVYHEETDVEIPNLGRPLDFRRRYDAIHTVSGLAGARAAWSDRGLGEGWSFSYCDRVEIASDGAGTVTWFTADGMRLVFTAGSVGGWTNPSGLFGTLSGSAAAGFTWKDYDGGTTTFRPAVAGACPIGSQSDRFGNGVRIDYVAGTNRITKVSDLRDATRWLAFTYNADARPHVSRVADFTGRTWSYAYVGGRLATTTAPAPAAGAAAPVVRYAYHADAARRGLLASVTDPGGFTTSWEYYANRRGFRVTDAEGLRHSFSYNLHHRQSAFINERGFATRYAYDDTGNLLELRQPDRTSERSTWNATGLKLTSTDAYGATTAFAYDVTTGKVTSVTDSLGNVTTYNYTTGAFRDIATIARLNRPNDASDDVATKFVYDASGFLANRTDDFGAGRLNAVTRFTAAAGGRGLVAATTSPRGVVTSFGYNAAGQVLTRAVDASPGVTVTESFTYNARGVLLTKTDGNGSVTAFAADILGRKTSERSPDPDGAGPLPAITSAFAYDAVGNLVATTQGDGRVVREAYDRRQRVVKRTAPDGTFTLVTYDPAGNKATETDALGRVTRFVYDSRGRLVATLLPDGTTARQRIDGGGRVVATIDQADATTTTTFDRLGRMVLETRPDPDGAGPLVAPATAVGYDSRGNVLFVTASFAGQAGVTAGDPAWSSSFEYDALGRKTKEMQADPDGTGPLGRPVTSFAYDADGNLASITDPRGFTTAYAYDGLGRKITETSADPDGAGPLGPLVKRFVFDKAGNLRFEVGPGGAGETDVGFTTEHVYDALGREIRTILPDPDGAAGPLARPVSTRGYDASGFLVATTDPLGRTTSFAYDKVGHVLKVTNAAGATQSTVFDAGGNPVITIDPLGHRSFFVYDAMNRKVATRGPRPDASAQTPITRFVYDVANNLVATIDPLGRTAWRQFDALGRVIAQTDALGIASGDPLHTIRTEYDAAGRVTAVIDELGRRIDTVYDNLGRKIRMLAPDAGQGRPTTHYGYDAAGNLRFTTDPRGASAGDPGFTTWIFYDALGRSVAIVDALGPDWPIAAVPDALPTTVTTNVVRTAYDARGRVASTTDALGRTTDLLFDNLGRKISSTAFAPAAGAERPVTRFAYDAVGNLTGVTDPLGFVTTYGYDVLDRRTTVTDARGCSTRTTYDAVGNTASVADASGNVTRYAYDRRDRLVTQTDPLGKATSYAYDLVGNRIRQTDRLSRVTSFVYDAADRLVEERWQASATVAVSHTIRRFYDAADELVGVTETDAAVPAAATAWQFTYDAGGNVVRTRMAPGELAQVPTLTGGPTSPGSLAAGDQTIDWDGDRKLERYDVYAITLAAGDQLLLTLASTAFDPVLILQKPGGGLATAVFDDSSGGGTTARLFVTADVAGTWVIAVSSRDENAAGGYDLQIVQDANVFVPDALVEYDFTYDKAGNLVATAEDQAAVAMVGGFGRAAGGLGAWTSLTVDALNRVTRYELGDAATGVLAKRADYTYRQDGSVASVARYAGAGVNPVATTASTFDGLGRIVGITHTPAAGSAIPYTYAYDAGDRVVSLTTPEGASGFTLDATDQLLSASLTGESYAYDATGNRTGGGAVTAAGNRLLFDGVYRYAYDAEGNRTAKFRDGDSSGTLTAGDSDVTAYGWDQRNRLVAVSHVAGWTAAQAGAVESFSATGSGLPGSDLELRYSYDFADRRIRRSLDADGVVGAGQESVSYAAYAGPDRTLEIARGGLVIRDGGGRVVGFLGGVVQRNFYGTGEDEILAVDRVSGGTTTTFWTLADRQGTVRDIVSGNAADRGKVVEHRQYDSYGKLVSRTTSPVAGSPATAGVGIDFGYAGRPLEECTGLSDNRARWYEPATGRFVNEDPSGFKGGDANLFRYVGNDPLNRIDPSGLMAKWAQPASRASVPATGWAGLGQLSTGTTFTGTSTWGSLFDDLYSSRQASISAGVQAWPVSGQMGSSALTTSAVTPRQPSMPAATPAAMPTYSLSSLGASAPRPAAAMSRPVLAPQPFGGLVTTGRAAPPVPAQSRWNLQDREAALRSEMAYAFGQGGLLKDMKVGYDANNPNNDFTRTGMSAMLTRSPGTGTYYLAFRGTEIAPIDSRDTAADLSQYAGNRTMQYEVAIELAKRVRDKLGADAEIHLTGHSLGGGLAAAAAHATGLKATVFNPASLSRRYAQGTPGEIRSHVIVGDPLSVGRTVQNAIFGPNYLMGGARERQLLPPRLTAPGTIILHPPRAVNTHGMENYPDY
jgi:RHS repeat-associated protein